MSRRFRNYLVASRNYRRNRKLVSYTIGRRRRIRRYHKLKGWL